MDRVTIAQLESRVAYLNRLTKNLDTAYTQADGEFTANVGNYHLDQAYSGVQLAQMDNKHGGISLPLRSGLGTKRECLTQINAFITGIESQIYLKERK